MITLAREIWIVFTRSLRLSLREPLMVLVALAPPVYFVVLFGPLWERSLGMSRDQSYSVFLPGLLVEIAVFGTIFAGVGLVSEIHAGLLERMRVTPVSRTALLLGRCARDIFMLLVQGSVLVALAVPFGFPLRAGPLLLTFVLMAFVALAATSLSYALATVVRSEMSLAALANIINLPLMLTSGILLPVAYAPDWLRLVSEFNPVQHAVVASRALFAGTYSDPSVVRALVIVVVVGGLSAAWAVRRFTRSIH
ncbi:ABC transporter permease [Streptomyces sp. NPDC058092]|uniref:ABC transporter permease n=1 Tax=Streptomyces sp. NPDC058092 TaxID=3346336 RepID=UPI0036ED2000